MEEIKEIVGATEEKLIPTIGMYWRDLNKTTVKESVKLLGQFAPTPAVADWILERVKWAPTQAQYREAY
jgi:hypothetical protein